MPSDDQVDPTSPDQPGRPAADLGERMDHARHEFEERFDAARAAFEETNERIRRRTGRDLIPAILVGLLLGGLLLVSILWLKWLFVIFAGAVMALAVLEFTRALRTAGRRVPMVVSTAAAAAAAPAAFFLHVAGLFLAVLAAIALVALWRLAEQLVPRLRTGGRALLLDLATGALVQVYVTLLAGFYLALTGTPGGEWWMLATLIVVVGVDTAAYVTGLNFGRHKLAPVISPGKTWEGAAGALVAALIGGVLLALLMLQQPWWVGLLFGAVLMVVGTMGDLTESMIKRDIGVKDMSNWLAGHGGFMDRVDSILPAGVVAFAFALVFDAGIPG